jgi:hypothetical protein
MLLLIIQIHIFFRHQSAAVEVPFGENYRRFQLARTRGLPRNPSDVQELSDLLEEESMANFLLTDATSNQSFYLGEAEGNFLFGSPHILGLAASVALSAFIDGTFKNVPFLLFYQLLVIHLKFPNQNNVRTITYSI